MVKLTVIICTYRPKPQVFQQALRALVLQTLPLTEWEVLIVANGDTQVELEQVPEALRTACRILTEPELGLTPARLCGIRASTSELMVFVDDDNVLDPGYLGEALALAERHPQLGAFGGWASPVYETEPSPELKVYADQAALKRPIKRPLWSNLYDISTSPFGAGMVVRRAVAQLYSERTVPGSPFHALDRVGNVPALCGDTDLAWTAIDIGLGCGVFPSLHFKHLTSSNRVTLDYLLAITEGFACCWLLLHRLRNLPLPGLNTASSHLRRLREWWSQMRTSPVERAFTKARQRGREKALAVKL